MPIFIRVLLDIEACYTLTLLLKLYQVFVIKITDGVVEMLV